MEKFVKSPEGIELAALCLDCGYKFTENPADLTKDQILFLTAALVHRIKQMKTTSPAAEGVTRIVVTDDEEVEA